MALPEVDVVIVGVGWVGGIIASELTKAGLNVVGLERGHDRGIADYQVKYDEIRGMGTRSDMFQNTALETWTLRHNLRETALPLRELGSFLPGTGVGGAGVHWAGQTWRFHPRDFTMRSSTAERYGATFIADNMSIQDWGITYDQLEPYYDKFEKMAGIAGKAGNLKGQVQPGGNPFEGPRSNEYPVAYPSMPHAPAIFQAAATKLGYKVFPQPSATLPSVYTNPDGVTRQQCNYCGFCARYGCEVGAKADPNVTVIPLAVKTGKFEIRTGANVFQIKNDGAKATSVLYHDALGRVQEQPARIVVLGAYVFNNVRLLLLSRMGRPYDPTTRSGVVGRNYAYQTGGAGATAFFDNLTLNRFMGSGAIGAAIDEFNADNFDHKDLGFIGGGSVTSGAGGALPIGSLAVPPGTRTWGLDWKHAIRKYYDSVVSVGAQAESPAYYTHFLDLDPTYKDAYGTPLMRITFDWEDNERKMVAWLAPKLKEIADNLEPKPTVVASSGTLAAHYDTVPYQSTHNTGGAIMGADPGTSVVNSYLQMWDFQNLWVVGACNFPQNAGFNPTGTVGALAYRAAEGIGKYVKNPGPLV